MITWVMQYDREDNIFLLLYNERHFVFMHKVIVYILILYTFISIEKN